MVLPCFRDSQAFPNKGDNKGKRKENKKTRQSGQSPVSPSLATENSRNSLLILEISAIQSKIFKKVNEILVMNIALGEISSAFSHKKMAGWHYAESCICYSCVSSHGQFQQTVLGFKFRDMDFSSKYKSSICSV